MHALAAPKMSWGAKFASQEVAHGLPQTAAFLRQHSYPGHVFAVQGLGMAESVVDVAVQLGAMTGMPAYLARPAIHLTGGEREKTALQRSAALKRLADEESAIAAGTSSAGAPCLRPAASPCTQRLTPGSQVASGGTAMISAMSSTTHAMNGRPAR
jgi:hypothetical protein